MGLGRLLWWLSEGDTMGRNYVSFDRKAAEARVRAERKRRERDRQKLKKLPSGINWWPSNAKPPVLDRLAKNSRRQNNVNGGRPQLRRGSGH